MAIHTRKKLIRTIDTHDRVLVETCIVDKFSLYSKKIRGVIRYFPTILLRNIVIIDADDKKISIDHTWIKADELVITTNICTDMVISFTARLGKYEKTKYQIEDYGLYDIDELHIINTSMDTDTIRIKDFLKEASTTQNKPLTIKYQYLLKDSTL